MAEFTRKERAELRRLVSLSYERELDRELEALDKSFAAWRSGQLSNSELSDHIHHFHDHTARDMWKFYNDGRNDELRAARAVGLGFIADDEVPPQICAGSLL